MGKTTAIRTHRARRGTTAPPRWAAMVALSALALLLLAAPAATARDLVVQSGFPPGMAYLSDSEARIVDSVERLTDGSLSLRFVGAGAIVPQAHMLEAVREGSIPAAFDWMGRHARRVPIAGLVAAMPFGPEPRHLASWLYSGGGLGLVETAYDGLGVVVLPCHMVIAEAGGWFNREITTPEDFQGLRMRIAGMGAEVLRRLGGEPSGEPVTQLYESLEAGRLDAVEFSVPLVDQSFGFEHFTRYYYFPGWHQPASVNALLVNENVWTSLTELQRAALRNTCRENVLWSMASGADQQVRAVEAAAESGVEVRRFPDTVLDRLRDVAKEVVAEVAAGDPLAASALGSMTRHLERARRWDALQALPRPAE